MARPRATAKPQSIERDAEPPRGPSAAEFAELRHQLVALTGKYNELKQATGGVTLLAPEEVPMYEVGPNGYYSKDDQWLFAGIIIEDLTGVMVPAPDMIPLNPPAEQRMAAYLKTLQHHGPAPTGELWIEATAAVLPSFNGAGMSPVERDAELHRLVLEHVALLRAKQMGLSDVAPRLPVMPQRSGPVPMMSNTRIRNGDANGLYDRVGAPAPQRGPLHTRVRAAAVDPANKAAPPMGTVHNQTLGRQ